MVEVRIEGQARESMRVRKGEEVKFAVELGFEKEMIEKVELVEGRLRVKIKEGQEEEGVRKVNEKAGGRPIARTTKQWVGIVAHGISTSMWSKVGGMAELRKEIEITLGTKLMKEPRWLVYQREWKGSPRELSSVFHVARFEERKRLISQVWMRSKEGEDDVNNSIKPWNLAMRDFVPRDTKFERGPPDGNKQCKTCCETGHSWWSCPRKDKPVCGLCRKTTHTSYMHPCATIRYKNKGECRMHRENKA